MIGLAYEFSPMTVSHRESECLFESACCMSAFFGKGQRKAWLSARSKGIFVAKLWQAFVLSARNKKLCPGLHERSFCLNADRNTTCIEICGDICTQTCLISQHDIPVDCVGPKKTLLLNYKTA